MKQTRNFNHALVTGGAGFIGINFCNFLKEKFGDSLEVDVVDSLTYASNLVEIEKTGFKIHQVQIQDSVSIDRIFEDARNREKPFDLIVNFAAESHVDQSINTPQLTYETNVIGVLSLLEACRKYTPEATFVQIGTDEVYGDKIYGESLETDLLSPSSPYSASKASADLLVLAYRKTFGLNTLVTRCTNNFGKFQDPEKFIPRIVWKAVRNKEIPVFGDGKQAREWIHVEDHVLAIWEVATAGSFGEIYNIGSGFRMSNLELVTLLLNAIKSKAPLNHISDRKGHDRRYSISSIKINENLKWKSPSDTEEKLKATAHWYASEYANNENLIKKAQIADQFYEEKK
jgi:dTDP-glucose 4,6-dehydratase